MAGASAGTRMNTIMMNDMMRAISRPENWSRTRATQTILGAATRELLAVGCLAALGQDRQLAGHARGAVRCGASPGQLHGALDAVADLLGAEALRRSRKVLETFGQAGG